MARLPFFFYTTLTLQSIGQGEFILGEFILCNAAPFCFCLFVKKRHSCPNF